MWSRVYVTVSCPSICLSVCPIDQLMQWHAEGLLLLMLCRQMSIDSGMVGSCSLSVCVYARVFLFCIVFIVTFISVIFELILSFIMH